MKNLVFLLRKFLWLIHIHLQDLFNSAFEGFKYQGEFGMFKAEKNSFTPANGLLVKFPSLVMSSIVFSDQKIEVAVKITVSWKKNLVELVV